MGGLMEQLHQNILEEDIEVFLQEADEHLQLMDQDVVQLESDPENPDLLQQIFRSSHTIKGSSAMLGHARMTEVAHSMENLLDRLRKGSATVTTGVIDVLLHSLDTLRALKDELITRAPAAVDVAKLVEDVEVASREAATDPTERDASGSSAGGDDKQAATATPITREVRERVRGLMASGSGAFSVEATVYEGTDWAAVRLFQVHAALSALSEVIVSWPSMDQIQAEEVDLSIRLLVCSQADDKDLGASLEQVEDLQDVQVVSWDPESEPEEGEEEIEEAEVSQLAIASEGADAGTASQGQVKAPARQQTVRVDVERIDHMMNTVGELIIDRTRIVQIGKALEARYKDDDFVRALGETSAHIVKVIDELQESTMKVRMLPIGTVFGSFPRLIRDLSQSIGKKVEFTIEGAETEIGIISDGNAGHVGRPIIRLCFDRDGEPVQRPYDIDLSDPDYQDRMVLQVLEY